MEEKVAGSPTTEEGIIQIKVISRLRRNELTQKTWTKPKEMESRRKSHNRRRIIPEESDFKAQEN